MYRISTLMMVGLGVIAVVILANVYILEAMAAWDCGQSGCRCGDCDLPQIDCNFGTAMCNGSCPFDNCWTCTLIYCERFSPQCGPTGPFMDCNGQG